MSNGNKLQIQHYNSIETDDIQLVTGDAYTTGSVDSNVSENLMFTYSGIFVNKMICALDTNDTVFSLI